jgi:sugar lactone lactonase YvrE
MDYIDMYQECIWTGCNILGESPIWDPVNACLYWIDMGAPILNCLYTNTAEYSSYKMPSPLCSIVLCKNGDILATTGQNIVILRQPDFKFEHLCTLDVDDQNIIFNDGKCDAQGRFWIGTRDLLQGRPLSGLYLFSEEHGLKPAIENLVVANGLGWSPDNSWFYLTDTIKKTIYRYPFDLDNAVIGQEEVFITVSEDGVFPDGLAVDSEGNIWVAMWGSGKILCYQKDGSICASIELPAKNVTSCCFGGKDYKILFVTSASIDFNGNNHLGKNAGGIFMIETSVRGLESYCYY